MSSQNITFITFLIWKHNKRTPKSQVSERRRKGVISPGATGTGLVECLLVYFTSKDKLNCSSVLFSVELDVMLDKRWVVDFSLCIYSVSINRSIIL